MKDGGMLINLNGSSYLTFMKEEADSYRTIVNNKTCIFQKENDPSILRFQINFCFKNLNGEFLDHLQQENLFSILLKMVGK